MFIIDELKSYPVNWTDGMRVGSNDFIATDKAWNDALRDVRVALLKGLQFGLLPPLRDSRDTSNYPKFRYDPSQGTLTLLECRAITEGGYRIEITEQLFQKEQIPKQLPSDELLDKEDVDVYITYNLDQRQDAGPISADAPPRHMISCPYYELSALPKKDNIGLSGVNHLKIAEFIWTSAGPQQNPNYIPPCFTMHTHPRLVKVHTDIGGVLNTTLQLCIELVQKYRMDDRKEVKDCLVWIESLMNYLGSNKWTFNDELASKSPSYTIIFLKNWVQYMVTLIMSRKNNPYMEKTQAIHFTAMSNIAHTSFDSSDLNTAFQQIEDVLHKNYQWLQKLGESFNEGWIPNVRELNR